jgi:DNA-3-methyladenine glycosylase I
VSSCWASPADPLLLTYHDTEWGRPVIDVRGIYERICLEAFQAGLAWRTVLAKRPAFRAAFANFQPDVVAGFGEPDITRLLADAGIIRHRGKIVAAIANARAAVALGSELPELVWSFRPPAGDPPASLAEVPAATAESQRLARALKRAGFVFVGPTTAYALMQACGLVNDHVADCDVRPAVAAEQSAAARTMAKGAA